MTNGNRFFTQPRGVARPTMSPEQELELLRLRKKKAQFEATQAEQQPEGTPSGVVLKGERADIPSVAQQRLTAVNPLSAFGLTDEAAGVFGGAASALRGEGFQRGFQETQQDVRTGLETAREERPAETLALELGGAVATGAALPSITGRAATTLGGRVAQGAKFGAGAGAVTGAGEAEGGLGERLKGAARGAPVGAVAGGALPVVGQGLKSAAGGVRRFFGGAPAASRAEEAVTAAFARDDLDLDVVVKKLSDTKPTTLADVGGENVRGLARTALGAPGTAREKGRKFLEERARKETSRINQDISELISSNTNLVETVDEVIDRRAQIAAPLYQKAYAKADISSPKLTELFERPAMAKAIKNAQSISANEGRGEAVRLTETRFLDDVKRGLDDVINKEKDPLTGKITSDVGRSVVKLKKEFVDEIDKQNPAYKTARDAFSSETDSLNALREGEGFTKLDGNQLRKLMKGMSENEKEMFRIGAVKNMRQTIAKAVDTGSSARRLFNQEFKREQIKELFANEADFEEFTKRLTQELQFDATRGAVVGGSQTAEKLAEQGANLGSQAGLVAQAVAGDPTSAATFGAGRLVQNLSNRAKGLGDKELQEINTILLDPSKQTNQENLARIGKLLVESGESARRTGERSAKASALAGALATQ